MKEKVTWKISVVSCVLISQKINSIYKVKIIE